MAVYLVHFDEPIGDTSTRFGFAQHYTGTARSWRLAKRLAEHENDPDAKIMAAVRQAGIGWTLARTWPGSYALERQLKQRGAARRCPVCKGQEPRLDAPGSKPYRAPGRAPERAAAALAPPSAAPRPWQVVAEPEPLEDFIVARLEPAEAAALVQALHDGQEAAWRQTAPGPGYTARFETACDLARLSGLEARASRRMAEAREIHAADQAAYREAALRLSDRRQVVPEVAALVPVRERRSEREAASAADPVARRTPQPELEAG